MALAAGTLLGPYQIQSPLGGGGMGEVYLARDMRLDRTSPSRDWQARSRTVPTCATGSNVKRARLPR